MRIVTVFLITMAVTIGLLFPAWGQAPTAGSKQVISAKTLDRFYDPVEVSAELFPRLLNSELSRLGLFAFHEGRLTPIPYQFDEWTEDGEMILKLGEENNADRSNNRLDPQDQLVFMARDAGSRAAPETWRKESRTGVEIEIIDPLNQNRAWVYLLYFPHETFPKQTKRLLEVDTGIPLQLHGATFDVVGMSRELEGKFYQTIINSNISVKPVAGGNGLDFIDRSKLRTTVRMLFGMIKLRLDEDNAIGGVVRYFNGPVRCMAYQWSALTLPMNLKSPRIYGSIYMYDTMVIVPVQLSFPFNPDYVLTDVQTFIGYDLHDPNGRGMKYYSNTNPRGFLMDGHMDRAEQKKYNDASDSWRCIVGPQGWMMHRSRWDKEYREQANIRMKYIDDVNHHSPPDTYPGDLGFYYTHTTIESIKPRTYNYQLELYWPYHLYTPDGPDMEAIKAVCKVRDNPLIIKVGSSVADNTAIFLKPLTP